ncbi:MAG: hypothetical protein H6850_00550 [Alphaproteobacteria bacterium]|nr:MAG: hypothetical protein H6850_00550 [Alphaproteobacteria bacterium]
MLLFLMASGADQPVFNPVVMQELLVNMSACSEHATNKDVIILGGLARTGKSTLINHLLFGITYQRKPRGRIEYSGDLPVPTSPQITGHTFYPHVYERDGKIFVDIAGMDGFEDFEHRLAGNIGWEMIIKKAKSVKLLFVVESDFDKPSAKAMFVKFLANVNRLLGGLPVDLNRLPDGIKYQTKGFLQEKSQSNLTLGFLINSKASEDSTDTVLEAIREEFCQKLQGI